MPASLASLAFCRLVRNELRGHRQGALSGSGRNWHNVAEGLEVITRQLLLEKLHSNFQNLRHKI